MDFIHANGIRFAYLTEGSGPLVLLLLTSAKIPNTASVNIATTVISGRLIAKSEISMGDALSRAVSSS